MPNRSTRGIPKLTYEPDLASEVKYPMSHYVSDHKLSESNKSFVNQLSSVSIPNSVQEALVNSKWKNAMNEEMKSLQKNRTWELVDLLAEKKPRRNDKITGLIVFVDDMVVKWMTLMNEKL
ncbi:unnamed protein product [Prunus brigantina]